jgi:preprotein translocase subunit SecG
MTLFVLASFLSKIGAGIFVLTCILLIGIILLQKGRGGGLSGAFGGAGGGQSAFGAKTGDVLTWATVALASFFLIMAIVMNFVFRPARVTAEDQPPGGTPTEEVSLPAELPGETPPATTQPAGEMTAPVTPLDAGETLPPTDVPADAPMDDQPATESETQEPSP